MNQILNYTVGQLDFLIIHMVFFGVLQALIQVKESKKNFFYFFLKERKLNFNIKKFFFYSTKFSLLLLLEGVYGVISNTVESTYFVVTNH